MFKLRSISGLVAASLVAVPAMLSFPADGWAQIEEIVVTTRRREENLQDVPISVDIISAGQIERFGIYNIQDVAKYTAGMEFDNGFGAQVSVCCADFNNNPVCLTTLAVTSDNSGRQGNIFCVRLTIQ